MDIFAWDSEIDIDFTTLSKEELKVFANKVLNHLALCKEAGMRYDNLDDSWITIDKLLIEDIKTHSVKTFGEDITLDDFEVMVSVSKDITKDFKPIRVKFGNLYKVANSNYNYSASSFLSGYRTSDNFLGWNNLIVLDIDSGWTFEEAKTYLESRDIQALLTTTKSHQKEKNGKVNDRFRIFMPTVKPFVGTVDQFKGVMSEVMRRFGGVADPACKDASRFYFGNPSGIFYYTTGSKKLSFDMFIPKPKAVKQKPTMPVFTDHIDDWFSENLQEGQRNQVLFRAYKFYKDQGLSDNEVLLKVEQINSQSQSPLEESEVKQICRIK